jgi:hypothetical protein
MAINQVIKELERHGATLTFSGEDGTVYVNGLEVLVRCTYAANTHTCVELFHESLHCRWVKSWGLTSQAQWLIHQDHEGRHYWYNLPALKEYISQGITNDSLQLTNNSLRTRERGTLNSNVMSVWIDKNSECDYLYIPDDGCSPGYRCFLSDVVRITIDDYHG